MAEATAGAPYDPFTSALEERLQRAVTAVSRSVSRQELARLLGEPNDLLVLTTLVTDYLTNLPPTDRSMADAFARGAAIKIEMIKSAGGMMSGEQVAALLGVTRQAIAKQRKAAKLLAMPTPSGDYVFPAYQFTKDGPVRGLAQALHAFQTTDPWYRLQVLSTPDPNLGGATPFKSLAEGRVEAVVDAIKAHDDI